MATVDTALRLLLFGEDKTASKALRGVGTEAGKAEGKLSKFGKGSKLAFGAVKAGIAGLVASEAVRVVTGLTDSYAELEDTTAAAGVVFGKSMDKIIAQSETASTTMGISAQQVIGAANTFGTYGKSAGLAGDRLAAFSTDMTQLAADMASFKGTSPEQAIEAIGSALRGEAEPIRAYGVLLDDASMRQQAMKMGLIKTTKEALSPQNKVLAAQALILKQTKDAQGDFARTSESTANVGKTAAAKWQDFQATLGEKLAPAVTAVTTAGIDMLDWLDQNPAVMEGVTAAGALLGDGLKGIWFVISKFVAPAIAWFLKMQVAMINGFADLTEAANNSPLGDLVPDDAADKIRAVGEGLWDVANGLESLSKEPKVDTGAEVAKAQVKGLNAEIRGLKGKVVEARAKGDDKEVKRLQEKIDKLRDKKVTVRADVRKTGINGIRIRDIARGNIKISAYASGIASAPGGPALVGENGPEALYLPAGSRVLSNGQTRAAASQGRLGGGSSSGTTVIAAFTTRPAPPLEFAKYMQGELAKLRKSQGGKFSWEQKR